MGKTQTAIKGVHSRILNVLWPLW